LNMAEEADQTIALRRSPDETHLQIRKPVHQTVMD